MVFVFVIVMFPEFIFYFYSFWDAFQFSWLQFILPICVDIQFFLIFLFFFCSESIRIYISINQLNNAYRISINQFYKQSLLVMHFSSNDSHLE